MGDLATTVKGIGGFGTCLYVGMLVYVSWRAFQFLRRHPQQKPQQQPSSQQGFPAKKLFHYFLLGSTLLDLVYYAKMAQGGVTANSYCLHLLAMWMEQCAFGFVSIMWARVLVRRKDSVLTKMIALDAIALIYTLVEMCLVIVNNNVDQFITSSSQPYILYFLANALVMLFLSISLLYHGIRLQHLVRNHPRWEPLRRERRLKIILKINGVLFVCGACFLLRTLLLFAHFLEAEAHQTAKFLDPAALVSWYIFANWIPFCVPATLLLYMMKNNGVGQERGNNTGAGLTLGLATAGGAEGTDAAGMGLKEWETPLVSPHGSSTSLLSREYWRSNLVSLYRPPQAAFPHDEEEAASALAPAATLTAPAAAASGSRGGGQKKAAVLDLDEIEEEVEERNEEKARLLSSETAPLATLASM